jgi:hypothetical protein
MPTKKKSAKSKKTTPKKTANKKTPTKKAAPKKQPKKKPLVIAPEEKLFWLTTGMTLAHLLDLEQALSDIEEEHYLYHADGESNDFAAWVDLVLCDEDCADSLRRARTQAGAKRAVSKHLKLYKL